MNDRYLFKAKRFNNGEWAIGNLVYSEDADEDFRTIIIPKKESYMYTDSEEKDLGFESWCKVDPTTLCQCTSWESKDKKLIFENDIVEWDGKIGVVKFGFYTWDESKNIGFYIAWDTVDYRQDLSWWLDRISVVGSIFDNPELLEVER